MPPNNTCKDSVELMEHRVSQLEINQKELFTTNKTITEILIRWDTKFSQLDFMQIHQQSEKLNNTQKKIETLETQVEELKKFQWKLAGIGIVLVFVLQNFFAPIVTEFFKPSKAQTEIVFE